MIILFKRPKPICIIAFYLRAGNVGKNDFSFLQYLNGNGNNNGFSIISPMISDYFDMIIRVIHITNGRLQHNSEFLY